MTLKILLVLEPSGGGSGRHVVDLADALTQAGHQVCVIYAPDRAEPRFEAELAELPLWAVERVPMRRAIGPSDIKSALALRAVIDRLGPFDVIHAHSAKAGGLARLVAPRGAVRVYTPHALRTMDPTLGLAGRLVYGSIEVMMAWVATDALIAVAPEEAEHARRMGMPSRKIHTVINGLRPPPVVDREAVRTELGLADDDVAVGFVGRLCAQKDPVRFAEAISMAVRENPKIKGFIFGDGELRADVVSMGVSNLQVLSGKIAREFLPALDVFALTSRYEGMPYVLVEALYAGLPIVTTDVGGSGATVSNDGNGLVLPTDASAEVVSAAIGRLAKDDLLRKRYQAQSISKVSAFTLQNMAAQTVAIYRSALDKRHKSKSA